jgi:hypothetical protein
MNQAQPKCQICEGYVTACPDVVTATSPKAGWCRHFEAMLIRRSAGVSIDAIRMLSGRQGWPCQRQSPSDG